MLLRPSSPSQHWTQLILIFWQMSSPFFKTRSAARLASITLRKGLGGGRTGRYNRAMASEENKGPVCFVIPTYNEAPNIEALLAQLARLYAGAGYRFIVVDDASPDGTGGLVQAFAKQDARVRLLTGARRGLGNAYVRGMTHALEELGAGVVVQMDADFSHDPADAKRLLARVKEGADVAIGSRYVPGGALDSRWSLRRRLLSRWGNHLARWIAGIKGVRDCTAGFKAIRAEALAQTQLGGVSGKGYVFQVELLHRLIHASARVVEVPIYFREREAGSTKLGFGSLVEFFYTVWWLRLAGYKTFAKFGLVGLSGIGVNLGLFQLMLQGGLHRFLASPIAIEASIIWNFILNNYWTFGDRALYGRKRVRGFKYNLVALLSLTVSYATFIALDFILPGAHPVALQAGAIVPAIFINYSLNSYWTFASPADKEAR